MDPLHTFTKEDQKEMQDLGFREWKPTKIPTWADPDSWQCECDVKQIMRPMLSCWALVFSSDRELITTTSLAIPSLLLFSVGLFQKLVIPIFWIGAVWKKESRFESGLRRRSFEENLEFYPVTRRAFNKAKSKQEQQLSEINEGEIQQLKEELAQKKEKLASLQK